MTLWAGRVGAELAPEVWEFLKADDADLLPYDCEATVVHARRLHQAGLLTQAELEAAEHALAEIEYEPGDEDVHTLIERKLGDVGRKIHAGRSRNDQVAAALRLYVADACADAVGEIERLAGVVLDRAEEEVDTPMPAYTHLQRAQPITLAHHLLAWVEMLERDRSRFRFAAEQSRSSPLGAGAAAGSTLTLPPPPPPVARNSLDAVADRDFALDYLYGCAMLASHLSRIGEEIVLWSTSEFAFVRLPEEAATGSSMMPQKLNPDVAELLRAKAGTALGRLAGLLAVVKGLPLAYNRDLQEDKTPVFAARRDIAASLRALAVLVGGLAFDRTRLAASCADDALLATDAAEAFVREGVPFRDAHERVAGEVRAGTFVPPARPADRPAPGPAGARDAIDAARSRFDARPAR